MKKDGFYRKNQCRNVQHCENNKLYVKIAEQQKLIKSLKREIADLTMVRLEAGEEMSPEIMERYTAIVEARETIAVLEQGRKVTRVVCPCCGTKTSAEMNYCGKCGTRLAAEEVVEEAADEAAEETAEGSSAETSEEAADEAAEAVVIEESDLAE